MGLEAQGRVGRDDAIAVTTQQARGDEVADGPVVGVGLLEVPVAGEHLAPQLYGAESLR